MFGKSATSITDYPTSNETFDSEHCVSLLQYSLKKKTAQVLESIEGFSYAEKQKVSIKIVWTLRFLSNVDCQGGYLCQRDGCKVWRWDHSSLPHAGYRPQFRNHDYFWNGTDMIQFGSFKRFCCWAGLTPGNNESAGMKKSVRFSRAGVYLKLSLVQVAHAVMKDNNNPY